MGRDIWSLDDKVSTIIFEVSGIHDFLVSSTQRNKEACPEKTSESDRVFCVSLENIQVSASYFSDLNPSIISFSINFIRPADLHTAHEYCSRVLTFLSMCFGWRVQSNGFSVLKSSDTAHDRLFYKLYVGRNLNQASPPPIRLVSPFTTTDQNSTRKFEAALAAWITNYSNRFQTITLLMQAIGFQSTLSEDRFMNACRWLDSIREAAPIKSRRAHDHLDDIRDSVAKQVASLGDKQLADRILGALSRVYLESHSERFLRLVPPAISVDNKELLPSDEMVEDLTNAIRLRGKIAHGSHLLSDRSNLSELWIAITALEAYCYLATLCYLTPEPNKTDLSEHPLVSAYTCK